MNVGENASDRECRLVSEQAVHRGGAFDKEADKQIASVAERMGRGEGALGNERGNQPVICTLPHWSEVFALI